MSNETERKTYTTNLDPKLIEKVQNEIEYVKREKQQQRHYDLLSKLQSFAKEVPMQDQQRISYELLSSLASALLDGTVFDIVRDLQEVQHLEEKTLFTWRSKLVQDQKAAQQQQRSSHQEMLLKCLSKPHEKQRIQQQIQTETQELAEKQTTELQQCHVRIVRRLDELSYEQQSTLQAAGVPGFRVCADSRELSTQITLLDFIKKLD